MELKSVRMCLLTAVWFAIFLKHVSCKEYFVVPSQTSSQCFSKYCNLNTLSEFFINDTSSNTTLFIFQGEHFLSGPIVINNTASFSMVLANNSNSNAQISCNESAKLVFSNISSVYISGITFLGCGRNQFESVKNLTIDHSKFLGENKSQTPLIIIESIACLNSLSFAFNKVGSYYDNFQFSKYLALDLSGSFGATVGGAMIINGTTLTVENCTFQNNSANIGGAIFSVHKSNITITNSVFTYNYAKNCDSRLCFGGSFFVDGSPGRIKFHNCTFSNGQSLGDGGIGAIFDTVLELSQSKFYNNVAERYGGVMRAFDYSTVAVDSSFFKHNTAYSNGGTMYIDSKCNSNVTLSVKNSKFSDNSAVEYGGVLFLQSSTVLIIYNTMQNNTAKSGGAIYANTYSNLTINYSTFTYNQATSDYKEVVLNEGGVVLLNRNSTLNINCSTFMYNTAKTGGGVISSFVSAHKYRSTVRSSNFTSNVAGQHGGVFHLQYGSRVEIFDGVFEKNKALTNGGVFDCFNSSFVKVSQSRFINNSCGYYGGVLVAKVMSNVYCERSVFYNSTGGILGGVSYVMDKSNLTLYGCNFSQNEARFGGAVALDRSGILTIYSSTFSSNTCKINGGVLFIRDNCKVTINSSHFLNNTANNDGVMKVADSSSILLSRCNISGNKAGHSGVVYAYDNSSISINSCNFINNEAGDSGGALYGRKSNITIIKSAIINCAALKFGGSMIIHQDSHAKIEDSNFTNSSANDGGVVNAYQSNVIINNCKFSENVANINAGVLSAVKASHIAVQATTFTLNFGGYGGVFFAFQNSKLVFHDCEFLNNKAEFEGTIKVRQQSTLVITNSTFKNNTAENGEVIYLQASKAAIEDSFYGNNEAKVRGGVIYGCDCSTVKINFNTFYNNMARNDGGVIALLDKSVAYMESSEFFANRAGSNGGTIFMQESFIDISDCTFNLSTAISGGIMYATHGILKIGNSSFSYNYASDMNSQGVAKPINAVKNLWSNCAFSTASEDGGAIYLIECSNATISDSLFEKNKARCYGGAISAYTMSTVAIISSVFSNNIAEKGGAIASQQSSIFSQTSKKNNDEIQIYNNIAIYGGGVYLTQSTLHFRMKTSFRCNQASWLGGGIHAINSSIFVESKVDFNNNRATSGGGVSLANNSTLHDITNHNMTTINFILNRAAEYGGALYVDDRSESEVLCSPLSAQSKCFFQGKGKYVKIYFRENRANSRGCDLFGGLLDRCTVNSVTGITYFRELISSTKFSTDISSKPVRVCLCNNSNKANCTQQLHDFELHQRDTLKISVVAVDQVGSYVPAVVHSSLNVESLPASQTLQKIDPNCTVMDYEVPFGKVNEDYNLTLYAEGPCADKGVSKLSITVKVLLCSCAPGLMPDDKHTKCACICNRQDKVLLEYINECNSSTQSVIRKGTFWITYLHHGDDILDYNFKFIFCLSLLPYGILSTT